LKEFLWLYQEFYVNLPKVTRLSGRNKTENIYLA
jgi:hypothetical protein